MFSDDCYRPAEFWLRADSWRRREQPTDRSAVVSTAWLDLGLLLLLEADEVVVVVVAAAASEAGSLPCCNVAL